MDYHRYCALRVLEASERHFCFSAKGFSDVVLGGYQIFEEGYYGIVFLYPWPLDALATPLVLGCTKHDEFLRVSFHWQKLTN